MSRPCSFSASTRPERAPRRRVAVDGASLVRVLAVPRLRYLLEPNGELRREGSASPQVDRRSSCRRRRRAGTPSRRAPGVTPPALMSSLQRLDHGVVVVRVDDREHPRVVLGGGPQHRRPADVDVLERHLFGHVRARDRLAERVEVHADEVDRPDARALRSRPCARACRAARGCRRARRVQRLHPPVENLREPRQRGDRLDRPAPSSR